MAIPLTRGGHGRNALSARSIFGVTTHVSATNSSTYCTTALKKFPDIRVVAPSLLSIPCILPQLFRAFAKFPATAGQSSSPAVITLPRYVNQGTDWICCPYTSKAISVLSLISASARRRRFLSAPLLHIIVLLWRPLRARHGTNMSQFSHLGWGKFPSSKMIMVSRTYLLQKCTRIAVRVPALPGHPSTGNSVVPPLGNSSLYVCASPPSPPRGRVRPCPFPLPFFAVLPPAV